MANTAPYHCLAAGLGALLLLCTLTFLSFPLSRIKLECIVKLGLGTGKGWGDSPSTSPQSEPALVIKTSSVFHVCSQIDCLQNLWYWKGNKQWNQPLLCQKKKKKPKFDLHFLSSLNFFSLLYKCICRHVDTPKHVHSEMPRVWKNKKTFKVVLNIMFLVHRGRKRDNKKAQQFL